MLEILSAHNTQASVSEIGYRKYLHQWICLPDMQVYVQARKVNEQLSDVSNSPQLDILFVTAYCSLSSAIRLECIQKGSGLYQFIYKHVCHNHLTCVFCRVLFTDLLQG